MPTPSYLLFPSDMFFPTEDIAIGDGYLIEPIGQTGLRATVPGGEILYVQNFFDKKVSDRAVEYFLENENGNPAGMAWRGLSAEDLSTVRFRNIRWKQDFISFRGKESPLPRLTAWYGDAGKEYTYSGIKSIPEEWNKGLLYMKEKVEEFAGTDFNSVLLNWYRDGDDCINWHADDEIELGQNPIIASVNFGETRDFLLRKNDDPSKKFIIPLAHGTLLLMRGGLQHNWQHSVPKRKGVHGPRFNLTFRRIG